MPAFAKRPGIVTFVGIVLIVIGSLALICGVCGSVGTGFLAMQPDPGGPLRPEDILGRFVAQQRFVAQEVPGYTATTIAQLILTILFGAVQITAGIGLLRLSRFGRLLAFIVTACHLLYSGVAYPHQMIFVGPAAQKFEKENPVAPPGQGQGPDMSAFGEVLTALSLGCGIAFELTVAILVFTCLNSQSAKVAFGVAPPPPEEADEDDRPRKKIRGYDDDDD